MRIQISSLFATLICIQLSTACTTSSGGETPAEESLVDSGKDQAASVEDSINGGEDKGLDLNDGSENKDSAASNSLAENSVGTDDNPDATLNNADAPMPADAQILPSGEEGSDLSKQLSDESAPNPSLPDETPASTLPSDLPASGSDDKAPLENSSVQSMEQSINQDITRITFARNSSKLSSDAKGILSQIAERMKSESSLKIKLQGFTDSRGSMAQNKRLAKSRAKAVKAALVSMGVEKSRVMIGEEHALNRRVEVIFK